MNNDADEYEQAAWILLGEAAEAEDGDAMVAIAELAEAAMADAETCRRRGRRLAEEAEDAANQREAQRQAAARARAAEVALSRPAPVREGWAVSDRGAPPGKPRFDPGGTPERGISTALAGAGPRTLHAHALTGAARTAETQLPRVGRLPTADLTGRPNATAPPPTAVRQQTAATPPPTAVRQQTAATVRLEPARVRGPGPASASTPFAPPAAGPGTPGALATSVSAQAHRVVAQLPVRTASPVPQPSSTGGDLLAYRKGRGLTQVQLAAEFSVTQGTIAKAEGAPSNTLGPSLLAALSGALGR